MNVRRALTSEKRFAGLTGHQKTPFYDKVQINGYKSRSPSLPQNNLYLFDTYLFCFMLSGLFISLYYSHSVYVK